MSDITPVPNDALIKQYEAAFDALEKASFPALVVEEVTDDGETFKALRCPRCGELAGDDDLIAVQPAESWASTSDIDSDLDSGWAITFDSDFSRDFGETLYYFHDNGTRHAVDLPEQFVEDWA